MANKPAYSTISGSAVYSATQLNSIFDILATAISNTVGLGGTGETNNSLTGTLDLNLNKIQNVLDPANNQDAATKAYVDSLVNLLTVNPRNGTLIQTDVYRDGAGTDVWTKPTGANSIVVEVWGAGGAGGSRAGLWQAAGGGGGGAYKRSTLSASVVGATETVTIGAGGQAGVNDGGQSNPGSTSFGAHVICSGATSAAIGGTPGVGGNYSGTGDIEEAFSGQPGQPGFTDGATFSMGGAGGAAAYGGGPGGHSVFVTGAAMIVGVNGMYNGGGGSGGARGNTASGNNIGGQGDDGYVVVKSYY